MHFSEIEQQIEKNNPLDFGDILSKSFELFKKTWQKGLIHMLLSILVALGVAVLIVVPMLMVGLFDPTQFQHEEPSPLMFITMLLTMFPAIFLASAFSMLLNAALFRIIKQIDLGESESSASFGMFMTGTYIKKALVLSFVTTIIAFVAALACYLPLFYVIVPLTLLGAIFAFNPDMSVNELLKLSFKIGHKKWLITFGLIIVSGLLAEIIGLLLCGIGIFVTASFVYLPTYYIYKDAIGFGGNQTQIDEIGSEYSN